MDHLALANQIKWQRQATRRQVRAARGDAHPLSSVARGAVRAALADAVEPRPRCLDSIRLASLLDWVLSLSEANRLLDGVGVSGVRRVMDLTDRQLTLLCRALRSPERADRKAA